MATSSLTDEWENFQQQTFSVNHTTPKPAGLPSQNPTLSFWTDSSPDANPLAREGSIGSLTSDADVCIIGSGITGVGVAYYLSEATQTYVVQPESPLKVVVLEARDFCACVQERLMSRVTDFDQASWISSGRLVAGSSLAGRNGGHLTPAAFSGFYARTSNYGPEEAKRSYALEVHTTSSLVRLIQEQGWSDDIDLVHGGHIRLLSSNHDVELVQRDREAAADAGWPLDNVIDLSKEEVEATFGAHHPAVKFPGYNLWPLKLVTKLYRLAKSRTGFDLRLHTHTPVTAISSTSSASGSSTNTTRAYALSTPRGTITCSRVVHATNGYASHLLPFLTGPQGIIPIRAQIIATRASVGTDQIGASSWTANEGSEYWFPRPVKTANEKPLVILGGARYAARPAMETYVDDDSACHPKVGEVLRAFLPALFKGKFEAGREPEMEWTGITGYTAIDDPFVGPIDKLPAAQGTDVARYTGQFIAAGYSGHGMPRAFGCAEVVAQMIMAELTGMDWTQPKWLPTRYLTWEERGVTIRD